MSILTQLGVIALIFVIILILIRANGQLVKAAEEGEHFVDEWALRQEKLLLLAAGQEQDRQFRNGQETDRQVRNGQETDRQFRNGQETDRQVRSGQQKDWQEQDRQGKDHWEKDWQEQDRWGKDHWEKDWQEKTRWEMDGEPVRTEEILDSEWDMDPEGTGGYVEESQGPSRAREVETGIELVMVDENRSPLSRIPVTRLPFTIGRAGDRDLVLDDLLVARFHSHIEGYGDHYLLKDDGTANQFDVEGVRCDQAVLKDGQRVTIGQTEFMVRFDESGSREDFVEILPDWIRPGPGTDMRRRG